MRLCFASILWDVTDHASGVAIPDKSGGGLDVADGGNLAIQTLFSSGSARILWASAQDFSERWVTVGSLVRENGVSFDFLKIHL